MNSRINIAFVFKANLILLALLLSLQSVAQNDVYIFGVVREAEFHKKVPGVSISIFQDGVKFNTVKTNSNGKYELVLNFDHEYKVVYSYPTLVTKFLTFNLKNVPEMDQEGGREINIDMELFSEIEGVDFSILDNPIGKFEYNASAMEINYNKEYTDQMKSQLMALMMEYNRKLKEDADRKAKMEKDFLDLVRKGDESVRNQKFSDAVDSYTDALVLFPKDEDVQTKKAMAEKAVAEALANQQKEDKYNSFINSGDTFFANEEWENALSSYGSASEIFPSESYPKGRIKEINEKLDALRANAANIALVAKLIKEGDNDVGLDKYDEAISKYSEALELIAGHKLAKQQLDAAKEKKVAWLAAQEREVNYTNLIAKADGEFNTNDYKKAITSYQAALDLKSAEQYPKDQIAKAEGIIGKASEETERRKEFDALVKQGDEKVNNTAYQEGIVIYKNALAIYPDDSKVKQKITDAEEAMNALLAAGEIDEQYKSLIAKADKSLSNKEYEMSKSAYQQALSLKADERYPKDKIAEINGILAGLAAANDASAKKELKAKFDKLVAQGDQSAMETNYDEAIGNYQDALMLIVGVKEVEDKIADAKSKQQALLANKAVDEQYNEWIKKGDRFFDTKKYEDSKDAYLEASLLFDKSYPKERIVEIDRILRELAKQSDESARMVEFARLEKEGDDYISAEDYTSGISRYTDALEIADEQRVVDKKAMAEKKLAALKSNMLNEEQYKLMIAEADEYFASESYSKARSLYQKAFAVQAEEYPKERIKEIDKLLLAIERKAAEEEAARLASVRTQEEWNSNTTDEERYVEEAQIEREELDDNNYEDLLKYKAAINETNKKYESNGTAMRQENASVIVSERQKNEDLFSVGEDMHDKKVYVAGAELEEYNNWVSNKSTDQLSASRATYIELTNKNEEIEREHQYKTDRYKDYARELNTEKEALANFAYSKSEEHNQQIKRNYYQSQELAAEQYSKFSEGSQRTDNMKAVEYEKEDKDLFLYKNNQKQEDRIKGYQEVTDNIVEHQEEQAQEENMEMKENYKDLKNEKEMLVVEEERWQDRSDLKREQANSESRNADISGEKAYEDYTGTKAKNYQQGVTEETYDEGNSKVVKRTVVKGNKADEYKMVVMRSGTYYFKNGFSITKNTWNNETESKSSYMD